MPEPSYLSYADQAMFLALRAAGRDSILQILWIYDRAVDLEGLRRFQRNLGHGPLARLVDPSPLPFGRHRWRLMSGAQAPLEVYAGTRPRVEVNQWADDLAALPLDPERGPAWRLGMQRLDDGGTAVSLVVSHCIADGGATTRAIVAAVAGATEGITATIATRGLRRGLSDLGRTVRDLPASLAVLAKAARRPRERTRSPRSVTPRPSIDLDRTIVPVPSAVAFVDLDQWDSRAVALGGTRLTLVSAIAARLAVAYGRDPDGVATLLVPMSIRGDGDGDANAVTVARIRIDAASQGSDLAGVRAATADGLSRAKDRPDSMMELLPLVPFAPKRSFATLVESAVGMASDLPTSCSNMGDLPREVLNADGTPADYVVGRGLDRHVTRHALDRQGGLLTVGSGSVGGRMSLFVAAYQPDADNTGERLRAQVAEVLREFGLDAEVL